MEEIFRLQPGKKNIIEQIRDIFKDHIKESKIKAMEFI